jgi:4-hydroxyphenylpyruvate dioxygenase-like putative hemolysin
MWILQFLPNWIFYLTLLAGIAAFVVTKFVRILPNAQLIQAASVAVVVFSVYMIGAISNNDAWLARVKEMETKVAEAEAKSATANTEIVEKTVVKTQVVKERGQDIIKYVDREVVKYDATCIIPKEFVVTHNRAAEAPKK